VDWGEGRYETTAQELEPASMLAVDAAGVAPGDEVLDVACGTGNAALIAAGRGARVVGIDGAPRLLDVARARARDARVPVAWRAGDVGALPFADDSFDVVLSVFGVIFAQDAQAAADELLRCARPGGRIVLATWIDRGPIAAVVRASRDAAERAMASQADDGAAVPPPRQDWGDPATLRRLFAAAGEVTATEHEIEFVADSPRDWIVRQDREHPSAAELRRLLSPEEYSALLDRLTMVLADGNEDPGGFRVASPCLVARVDLPV
jgi:ubiquinone/menaquinone biosynthesis C-methylase UbiE